MTKKREVLLQNHSDIFLKKYYGSCSKLDSSVGKNEEKSKFAGINSNFLRNNMMFVKNRSFLVNIFHFQQKYPIFALQFIILSHKSI